MVRSDQKRQEGIGVALTNLAERRPIQGPGAPPAMAAIQRKLKNTDDGGRQMAQILSFVPSDGLQAVEAACREALGQGVHSAPVVIIILVHSRDPAPAVLLRTPATSRLTHEPVADCAHHDSLRRTADMERTQILDLVGR